MIYYCMAFASCCISLTCCACAGIGWLIITVIIIMYCLVLFSRASELSSLHQGSCWEEGKLAADNTSATTLQQPLRKRATWPQWSWFFSPFSQTNLLSSRCAGNLTLLPELLSLMLRRKWDDTERGSHSSHSRAQELAKVQQLWGETALHAHGILAI